MLPKVPKMQMKLAKQTFAHFVADLQRLLGENLYDIIIHGSYVLKDFRPNLGDLDYLVVTRTDLTDVINGKLFELHDGYRSTTALLLHQLEGTFYPFRFLATLNVPFTGCYIGTGRAGWRTIDTLQNSYIDLKLVESTGLHLLGRSIQLYHPTKTDILTEQRRDLEKHLSAIQDPTGLSFGFCMSVVHWCGRTLYYLKHSRIVSKSVGCRFGRRCTGREDFRKLFALAERLRYPYKQDTVSDDLRSSCQNLLDHVGKVLLRNTPPESSS